MAKAFGLSMPIWEIALRTSIVYLAVVLVIRVVPKRRAGTISPNDMLSLVLIGACAGDAIMGGATSISDILLMIGIVIAWAYVLEILEYQFPSIHRFLRDTPTPLIRNGRFLRKNLEREMVTDEELMAVLREEGIEDPALVRSAILEADGHISVVKNN